MFKVLAVKVYKGCGKGNTVSEGELVITLPSFVGAGNCTTAWLNSGIVFRVLAVFKLSVCLGS